MIVETPQILWNAAEGETQRYNTSQTTRSSTTTTPTNNNKAIRGRAVNAALYSVDIMASGLPEPYHHILVTAGNCSQVNVWSLLLNLPVVSTATVGTRWSNNQDKNNNNNNDKFHGAANANNTTTTSSTIFQRKPTVLTPVLRHTSSHNNSNHNNNNIHGSGAASGVGTSNPTVANATSVVGVGTTSTGTTPTGNGSATTSTASTGSTATTPTTTIGSGSSNSASGGGLEYRFSLGRSSFGCGTAVNSVKFSPCGLYLAVAYETHLQMYAVPWHYRGNDNGRHYWAMNATGEGDLVSRRVRHTGGHHGDGSGLTDLAWSAKGQHRLVLGNIDHSITLVQRVVQQQPQQQPGATGTVTTTTGVSPTLEQQEEWHVVCRISEHSHFVQGVAYDPLGVYLTSMSNDRSVRLYPRKATAKTLKKVLLSSSSSSSTMGVGSSGGGGGLNHNTTTYKNNTTTVTPSKETMAESDRPPERAQQESQQESTTTETMAETAKTPRSSNNHKNEDNYKDNNNNDDDNNNYNNDDDDAARLQEWLATSKFELAKTRIIKYAPRPSVPALSSSSSCSNNNNHATTINNHTQTTTTTTTTTTSTPSLGPRHCWFADESTVESFFRRLDWTPDGQFLICPTALYKGGLDGSSSSSTTTTTTLPSWTSPTPQHAVLVFARHNFDEPYKIWTGLARPAVAIRPNPIRFALPETEPLSSSSSVDNKNNNLDEDGDKENARPSTADGGRDAAHDLPYRTVVAVLTWDSVVIYDTYHDQPLALLTGLHYANLTDATWTANGHDLLVASSDGYLSLIRFAPGELGTPLDNNNNVVNVDNTRGVTTATRRSTIPLGFAAQQPQPSTCSTLQPSFSPGVILPPCEPGPVQLATAQPPSKKAKVVVVQKEDETDVIIVTKTPTTTRTTTTTPEVNRIAPTRITPTGSVVAETAGGCPDSEKYPNQSSSSCPLGGGGVCSSRKRDEPCAAQDDVEVVEPSIRRKGDDTPTNNNDHDNNKDDTVVIVSKKETTGLPSHQNHSHNTEQETHLLPQKKKKKRIQPVLVTTTGTTSTMTTTTRTTTQT